MKNWTVLAAGPSVLEVTDDDLLPGPFVAINRAICSPIGRSAPIWAMWDDPDLLWKECSPYLRNDATVWICPPVNPQLQGHIRRWEQLLRPTQGYRLMSIGSIEWEDGSRRSPFTLLYVIDKICDIGAQRIKILGADMKGSWMGEKTLGRWDADEATDIKNDHGWDRWKFERTQMERVIEVAKERGVEIELARPESKSYGVGIGA